MKNKIFIIILLLITLSSCGFSPIYIGSSKQFVISKSEVVGNKDLAFNLEQKLNFKKDEKDITSWICRRRRPRWCRSRCHGVRREQRIFPG
jgi:hypothetical protein